MTKTKEAWEYLKKKFKDGMAYLSEGWGKLWDGFKGIVISAWEGIKGAVKSGINWVIRKINAFINQANRIASKVPGIPSIPNIAELAKGGIVTKPTFAMLGEKGPEAVVPLKKGGARIGSGITLNISGNSFLDEDSAERMGDLIIRALKSELKI